MGRVMKQTLFAGDRHVFSFPVSAAKTVPALYPESDIFRGMPGVFATGFMVGLMEWACAEHLRPHLDEGEGSLGVSIDVSHVAATPPGMTVTVTVTLEVIDGRRLRWHVSAHDGLDLIGEGWHERAVVQWDKFLPRIEDKKRRAGLAG